MAKAFSAIPSEAREPYNRQRKFRHTIVARSGYVPKTLRSVLPFSLLQGSLASLGMLEKASFATLISFQFTLGGEVWLKAAALQCREVLAARCAATHGGWSQSLYGS